jgi:hypothetical protein
MTVRQIQYKLACTKQVEQVYKRFYPPERFARPQLAEESSSKDSISPKLGRYYASEELDTLAGEFATQTPNETYSVAELQGYLLNYKWDPQGAVGGMPQWIKEQREEKARIEEAKNKRKMQRKKVAMEGVVEQSQVRQDS